MRVRVFISGRVQGVWFRESTRKEATRLGVAGWVRNRSDGRVEACFEGPEPGIKEMLAWCRQGPTAARVDEVTVEQEEDEGEDGFWVRQSQ